MNGWTYLRMLVASLIIVGSFGALLWAADYQVTIDDGRFNAVVQYFAQLQGRPVAEVVSGMCRAGIASFQADFVQRVAQQRAEAFRQMTPEQRQTVCAVFASVGSPCPAEEP